MRDPSDEDLEKVAGSLCSQIKAKVDETGASGVVVGLSGGIDSALVCTLCSRVVDTKALLLPDVGISSGQDQKDALELCRELDISHETIDIHDVSMEIIKKYPAKIIPGSISDINIRPRLRMLYLYLCANEEHRLVAGTSNLTEINLGYCTKWGDNAADFLPIAELWKTEVTRMANVLGIPKNIVDKKPSAGLYFGQTDEGELGAGYDVLDDLLYEYTVCMSTRSELYKRHGKELVDSVISLMERNCHKRTMPQSLEVQL